MGKARVAAGVASLCMLVGASAGWADPTVAQMLSLKPKQTGVVCTTPAANEQSACQIVPVEAGGKKTGWLLKDDKGNPLRRFYDAGGGSRINTYSYYLDGVEIYREIDADTNQKIDQYRWLNGGGMKWGIDSNEDGRIDSWKVISAEEVSQEILQAVQANDFTRLQPLMLTEAEIKTLALPTAEATRIRDLQSKAAAKFQATVTKVGKLGDKVQWLQLQGPAPQCVPADATGMRLDLIKQANAAVLYEANGKHDLLQVGEMIQIGLAWRIIDAPGIGGNAGAGAQPNANEAILPLLDELRKLDATAPKAPEAGGANPAVVRYNLQRADVVKKIVAKVQGEEQVQWQRQLIDSLHTAAQYSDAKDKSAYDQLAGYANQIVKAQPGSALAAYAVFREMTADYAWQMGQKDVNYPKLQEEWLARLAKFVKDYAKAEDTPEALWQLGMVSEFIGKDTEAKNWYLMLVKDFDAHPLAPKAAGAVRRLGIEGKELDLTSPTIDGGSFDIAKLKGKVVVVYYWASWNQQCLADFARLAVLTKNHGSKGLEVVSVNLDNTIEEAKGYLQKSPSVGTHLFQPGGLESPLAKQYGIMVLPNLFLVGKDGKVVSRTVQISNLEEEIRKQVN